MLGSRPSFPPLPLPNCQRYPAGVLTRHIPHSTRLIGVYPPGCYLRGTRVTSSSSLGRVCGTFASTYVRLTDCIGTSIGILESFLDCRLGSARLGSGRLGTARVWFPKDYIERKYHAKQFLHPLLTNQN